MTSEAQHGGAASVIRIGTCGYSYKDWVGPFYPVGTKPGDMLALYAKHFPTVEIDATYYRVLPESTFASMARRTPAAFTFTAKLPGTATHVPLERDGSIHADVALFRRSIEPLVRSGKFACALMQFPTSFRPSDATQRHVRRLRDALEDIPLVAEFRHREWQTSSTLDLLRELDVGWVNVDQPQFRSLLHPSSDVTSSTAYIRFHGRNYEQWWKGTNETRYDYLYRADELEPWAARLVDLAAEPRVREVLAFFNNHRREALRVTPRSSRQWLRPGSRAARFNEPPERGTAMKSSHFRSESPGHSVSDRDRVTEARRRARPDPAASRHSAQNRWTFSVARDRKPKLDNEVARLD